ncbi:hypothetical protein [Paenibacillus agricola]|uniref:Uncharacterized protein n=1 Tax=Paenibacillus agricola TaxID=2716264 RepID=A0ABX0JGM8_9BACL|nr:hypothetical protein [Paenibacillus agricola]NHN33414.1 hypothetical protein [Paenibacillus agricola]
MARLEYRLFGEGNTFPVLYYYDRIDLDEVSMRFACDYFIKEGTVYEKTSCAAEVDGYVIYVKRSLEEKPAPWGSPRQGKSNGLSLELREFSEYTADYKLIHTFVFQKSLEMLLRLQANYVYREGVEWSRTSTEIDEDRETYVYYAVLASSQT